MTPDFEDFIKTFKPEFGNKNHIFILEQLAKMRKKERLVNELLTNQTAIKKHIKEIGEAEKHIIFMINNERNKNNITS